MSIKDKWINLILNKNYYTELEKNQLAWIISRCMGYKCFSTACEDHDTSFAWPGNYAIAMMDASKQEFIILNLIGQVWLQGKESAVLDPFNNPHLFFSLVVKFGDKLRSILMDQPAGVSTIKAVYAALIELQEDDSVFELPALLREA